MTILATRSPPFSKLKYSLGQEKVKKGEIERDSKGKGRKGMSKKEKRGITREGIGRER